MDENQIHEFLYRLDKTRRRLTPEEMAVLYELSRHPNPQVRSDVAALLVDHYEEKSEQILLRMTHDPNSLVRADAADSLCIGRHEATLKRLIELAEHDPEYVVRGLAVHSTYDVFVGMFGDSDQTLKTAAGVFLPLLERESNRWVHICYYCVLYLCGKRSFLEQLLNHIDDEDYYVRNSVLDTFEDILDEENEKEIEEAIQYHLPFEEQETLAGKMSDLLLVIQDYDGEYLD